MRNRDVGWLLRINKNRRIVQLCNKLSPLYREWSRMRTEERVANIKDLQSKGLSMREIAAVLRTYPGSISKFKFDNDLTGRYERSTSDTYRKLLHEFDEPGT